MTVDANSRAEASRREEPIPEQVEGNEEVDDTHSVDCTSLMSCEWLISFIVAGLLRKDFQPIYHLAIHGKGKGGVGYLPTTASPSSLDHLNRVRSWADRWINIPSLTLIALYQLLIAVGLNACLVCIVRWSILCLFATDVNLPERLSSSE
jgi:hypothetical protein